MYPATIPGRNGREASVFCRYANAAREKEDSLCCPVRYSREFLNVIPQEVLDRDYGCGDPTPYVLSGDTVLDLGSGGGKVCYILSQVVGSQGRVIGVDYNPEMLELARRYREQVAAELGYQNVEFRCGLIQDLALDLEELAGAAAGLTLHGAGDIFTIRELEHRRLHDEHRMHRRLGNLE